MVRRSKKYLVLIIVLAVISVLTTSCSGKETLLFLNWGEYINYEMVEAFEKEYNCNVIVDLADSNELFYAKVKGGTTAYDLVCPAEYMVQKMYMNDLLQPLYSSQEEFEDYFPTLANGTVNKMDGVLQIEDKLNQTTKEAMAAENREYDDVGVNGNGLINQYHMPYFWGTFGLMYNKQIDTFKDEQTWDTTDMDNPVKLSDEPDGYPDILQRNNAWKVYFSDPTLPEEEQLPSNIRIGQYSAVRFTYGAVMTYLDGTPNTPVNDGIERFKEVLSRRKVDKWAADELKHSIESHTLDIAFAYTGDCLDMVYLRFLDRGYTFEEIDFFTYAPTSTMAHIDSLVIPKNARHADLARKFINFLLDPNNAWLNNRDIGYIPPLKEVYNMIVNQEAPVTDMHGNLITEGHYLYFEATEDELFWRENWAKALQATKPRDGMDLVPFSYFTTTEINNLNNVVNNIKVS